MKSFHAFSNKAGHYTQHYRNRGHSWTLSTHTLDLDHSAWPQNTLQVEESQTEEFWGSDWTKDVLLCSYPAGGWCWQNWGAGYHSTWTGSATTWAPHSYGSLSGGWHCGSGLGLTRHSSGMSALSQSACSSPQVGNRTRLMSAQSDWRQRSQIWACSGLGRPHHHSRSPLRPERGGGSADEERVEGPGEESSQQRMYPCLQADAITFTLHT